jgi:PAS domain S-box-containing protein
VVLFAPDVHFRYNKESFAIHMNNPFSARSAMGIRKRVFSVLIIILVPFLLLEAFFFYKWFDTRKEVEMQANLELARAAAINFETFLQGLIRDELAVGLALTSYSQLPDEYRDRFLDKIQADNPAVRSLFWITPDGMVIASSLRSYIGLNLNDRSYFRKVKEGHNWWVSELIIGKATQTPSFVVSRAIRADDGELLGVVAASIEPDRLQKILGVDRLKDAGLSLVDSKGMHVTRYPPTEYTWEQRNWLKLYPAIEESLQGKEISVNVTSKVTGKKRFVVFVPVPLIGWVAAASRAESDIIGEITQILMPQIGFILLVTLVAFGLAVGLSRPITQSILKLKSHAAAIGQGEIDHKVADGPYELKILADTLNEMNDKIRSREASIRESESLYRAIVENFPEGVIFVFDHNLRFRAADGQALATLGCSRESLVGKAIGEIKNEQISRILDERCPRVLTGEYLHNEISIKGRILSSAFVPIKDENGKVLAGMVVSLDITERKKAEEAFKAALAKAEEGDRMLAALMESVPEGIAICDAHGNLRMLSKHGLDLLGGAHAGKSIKEVAENEVMYRPDSQTVMPMEELPLVRALKGETVRDVELVQVNYSGRSIPLLCNSAPIRGEAGEIVGGIVAWRDITERKQAEIKLRHLNETLEQKVAERSALAEARLNHLQRLAVELIDVEERERRKFSALLHDDLQQLLVATRMQLESIFHILPNEPTLSNIRHLIEESITKSRSLSHELFPPVLQYTNMGAILKWITRHFEDHFGLIVESQVDDELHINNDLIKVFLFRAIREFLFNIVKHSGVKNAQVTIVKNNGCLVTTVIDKGRGFDIAILNSSASPVGLGLLSLNERARYLGGSLVAESGTSEPGSRFALSIPFSIANSYETKLFEAIPQLEKQAEKSCAAPLSSMIRILFVDDHAVIRQSLISLIGGQPGILVAGEASNGREAIDQVRQLKPDAVVMDVSMPEMDGIEATYHIKSMWPHVRVIALSMFEDEHVCRKMRDAGAEAFVRKTASSAELLNAIFKVGQQGV